MPPCFDDRDGDNDRQTSDEKRSTADDRGHDVSFDGQGDNRHQEKYGAGQPDVGDKHADKLLSDVLQQVHRMISLAGRRRSNAMPAPVARNMAANRKRMRSCPGQSMPSPSPVQNTPNADNITPTPNFNMFSGTCDNGR